MPPSKNVQTLSFVRSCFLHVKINVTAVLRIYATRKRRADSKAEIVYKVEIIIYLHNIMVNYQILHSIDYIHSYIHDENVITCVTHMFLIK